MGSENGLVGHGGTMFWHVLMEVTLETIHQGDQADQTNVPWKKLKMQTDAPGTIHSFFFMFFSHVYHVLHESWLISIHRQMWELWQKVELDEARLRISFGQISVGSRLAISARFSSSRCWLVPFLYQPQGRKTRSHRFHWSSAIEASQVGWRYDGNSRKLTHTKDHKSMGGFATNKRSIVRVRHITVFSIPQNRWSMYRIHCRQMLTDWMWVKPFKKRRNRPPSWARWRLDKYRM